MEKVYVLYSKYSDTCTSFLERSYKAGVDIISPICIDNPKVRRQVMSSALSINHVPCIIGTLDGFLVTYQGKDAFKWLENVILSMRTTVDEQGHEQQNRGLAMMQDSEVVVKEKTESNNPVNIDTEQVNGHVDHKLQDPKTIAEQMARERDGVDKLVFGDRRVVATLK